MQTGKRLFTVIGLLALSVALPALAGPKETVVEAFKKAFERGSYRAEVTTQVGGKPYPTQMDVQWPDRFHMTSPDSEIIILPGATWMNAGGRWMQMPMDMSRMIEGYSKQAIDESIKGMGDVREIGSEDVRGCASTVYAYTSSGKFMGVNSDADAEVAICSSNGLPVRVSSREKGSKDSVTIYYDFEAKVDIRAPN